MITAKVSNGKKSVQLSGSKFYLLVRRIFLTTKELKGKRKVTPRHKQKNMNYD
jgi:hypothetical protein